MIPVLSKESAIELEKQSVKSGFISKEQLMDNAGKAVAQFIIENIPNSFNQEIKVIAGPGNNGGDGIICYHYLSLYGAKAELWCSSEKELSSSSEEKLKGLLDSFVEKFQKN